MSAPSAPIDSSLPLGSRDVFYVLESDGVWKTSNLTAVGAATWTEIYTDTLFEAAASVTNSQFMRVVAASETLIYVLAIGQTGSDYQPWIIVSSNGGTSWNSYLIDSTALTVRPYTVDIATVSWTGHAFPAGDQVAVLNVTHNRFDAGGDPWVACYTFTWEDVDWFDVAQYTNSEADNMIYNIEWGHENPKPEQPTGEPDEVALGGENGADHLIAHGWINAYFGTTVYPVLGRTIQYYRDAPTRNKIYFEATVRDSTPNVEGTIHLTSYVFWNIPSIVMPKAIDVARTNNNWLYVGLTGKIKASEDGGVTWFDFYTTYGANDICVDPLLAGAVYHWSTTGFLNLLVKQGGSRRGKLSNTGLISESPASNIPLRIARDPSSGKLWALPNGTKLVMRDLGSASDQQTGLSGATGLHAYIGYKLIFCDNTKIYISDNSGTTITDKTGGWAGTYTSGKNAHRLPPV